MDEQSLANVNDIERRIKLASANESQQAFVRTFISELAQDCSVPMLIAMAECALELRKSELKTAADWN